MKKSLVLSTATLFAFTASESLADYASTILSDNPVAYYRLNEAAASPTASDLATPLGANDGALEGGTVTLGIAGLINEAGNTAGNFGPGNGRFITAAFDKIGTGFSVEFWINISAMPTSCCSPLVSDGDGADGDGFFLMNYLIGPGQGTIGDIRPHYSRVNNPLSSNPGDSNQALAIGQTYHVVTTWDGSPASPATNNAQIYINGVLDRSLTTTKNFDPANENNLLFLGRDNRTGYGGAAFVLDEVALYDFALTATDASEHYQAGLVPEPSSIALLAAAAGSTLLARRRRR